jgi:hypothetical protein
MTARGAFWLGYVTVFGLALGYWLIRPTFLRFLVAVGACIAYVGVVLIGSIVAEELRLEGEPPL